MTEGDDDESFGDFKFAPSSSTISINPPIFSDQINDDWGDFINHSSSSFTGISHSPGSPTSFYPSKPVAVEKTVPEAQVEVTKMESHWAKPRGALPLSIFGLKEDEVEDESGAMVDLSFPFSGGKNDVSVKNGSILNNDLVYTTSPSYRINENVYGAVSSLSNLHFNGVNSNHQVKPGNKNGSDSILSLSHFQSNGVNSNHEIKLENKNGMDSISTFSNSQLHGVNSDFNWDSVSGSDNFDDDDGWEFKGADSDTAIVDRDAENDQTRGDNGWNSYFIGSTTSTSALTSDSMDLFSSFVRPNLIANGSDHIVANGDVDDDDGGWDFKGVESEPRIRDENLKGDQINGDNGLHSNFIGSTLKSTVLRADSSDLFSSFVGPNSVANGFDHTIINSNGDDYDDDDDGGWEFKGVESDSWVRDEKHKEEQKTANISPSGIEIFPIDGDDAPRPNNSVALSEGRSHNSGQWDFRFGLREPYARTDPEKQEEQKTADISPSSIEIFPIDGDDATGPNKAVALSEGRSHNSGQWDFGFSFNSSSMTEDDFFSDANSKSVENEMNSSLVDPKFANTYPSLVEEFTFSEEKKRSEVRPETHKEPLPLSIFCDGNLAEDPLPYKESSIDMSTSFSRNTITTPGPNISISDLISSLYVQAEESLSLNDKQNDGENLATFTKPEKESYSVSDNDDFEDDSWEFKDASPGTTVGDQTSVVHSQKQNEYMLDATQTELEINLVNESDFDDNSWEFKDVISGAEDQTSVLGLKDSLKTFPSKSMHDIYVSFYCCLYDELCVITRSHLENLKKAKSIAALSGEDEKITALNEKIRAFQTEVSKDFVTSKDFHLQNLSAKRGSLEELLEVLQDPLFQVLESEYDLSRRLSVVETDSESAIELLKHTELTLKIMRLASTADQSNYISTFCELVSVCTQELKHGASIWKKSLQKNFHNQVLFEPQGKKNILGLGEIYRVVEVLGASSKLYRPWILCSADPKYLFNLLADSYNIWLDSGLVDALKSISDPVGVEYDGTVQELLDSIEYLHDLDSLALQYNLFYQQEPVCCLSGLTPGTLPGMQMVEWYGEQYFLKLANLWANLVRRDPPKLSFRHIASSVEP